LSSIDDLKRIPGIKGRIVIVDENGVAVKYIYDEKSGFWIKLSASTRDNAAGK